MVKKITADIYALKRDPKVSLMGLHMPRQVIFISE